jgi:hypothetical protein
MTAKDIKLISVINCATTSQIKATEFLHPHPEVEFRRKAYS